MMKCVTCSSPTNGLEADLRQRYASVAITPNRNGWLIARAKVCDLILVRFALDDGSNASPRCQLPSPFVDIVNQHLCKELDPTDF